VPIKRYRVGDWLDSPLSRRRLDLSGLREQRAVVEEIVRRVAAEGDPAVREYGRRFDGWATHRVIFVRRPELLDDDDLITHELCHVWQMQHRPVRMPWSYLFAYQRNPYELQARRAERPRSRPYQPGDELMN